MDATVVTKVPCIVSDMKRCRCTLCPVQADSECAQEKYSRLKNEIESSGGVEALAPQKVPGIYCSIGTATCGGLRLNKQCICNTCPVWEEYNLRNGRIIEHYCTKE